jgi:hypothetical protein
MTRLKWPDPKWFGGLALFAMLYGLVTLKEGGSVLFIDGEARAAAGQYVPFVLWFNFLAGFAYIAAGGALWLQKSWGVWLACCIALGTMLVFAAFAGHVVNGGAYETRTVLAMSARTLSWTIIAAVAWLQLIRRQS